MNFENWLSLLVQQLKETPLLQWTGVSFGVLEVFLAKANKVWLYPAGIISTSVAIYSLFEAGLYAESALNLYYFVMSIYGWWYWIHRKDNHAVEISRSNLNDWLVTLAIVATGFVILYAVLINFTPSTVPFWDAWVSATAWAGMWLLAKRKIENWILLNLSNAFAIPLLFSKGLPLYGLLTIILFCVAIWGYFQWQNLLRRTAMPAYSKSENQNM